MPRTPVRRLASLAALPLLVLYSAEAHDSAGAAPGGPDPDRPVMLVTGSTGGLGRVVALRLAGAGAHVIVHGRDEERGREVVREIEGSGTGSARFYAADFGSLDEVRALGERVLADYDRLDVLVNNAGIWLGPDAGRLVSEDGHELHFQVNHLAGFLLTQLLLPRLLETPGARVVNVASAAQRPIEFDDVMLEREYSDGRAYAQSKLAQVLFTFELAERLEGTGLAVNALHPATLMDTEMVLARGIEPRASVEDGADAVVHLATGDGVGTGRYFNGLEPARANAQAYDPEARTRLWRLSEELTRPD